MSDLSIVIPHRPVPKKNNMVMLKDRNLILPSKAYRDYHKFCVGTKTRPGWLLVNYGNHRIDDPVEMWVDYFLPNYAHLPDVSNLINATCDLLQDAGIVWNDSQIWQIHAAISGIDKAHPRTEIQLEIKRPWWEGEE